MAIDTYRTDSNPIGTLLQICGVEAVELPLKKLPVLLLQRKERLLFYRVYGLLSGRYAQV